MIIVPLLAHVPKNIGAVAESETSQKESCIEPESQPLHQTYDRGHKEADADGNTDPCGSFVHATSLEHDRALNRPEPCVYPIIFYGGYGQSPYQKSQADLEKPP